MTTQLRAGYDLELKNDLHRYLRVGREALVWKLEGLSEYDRRRPLVGTGTNLLGLVKHLIGCEAGYFGATFGRPFPEAVPWFDYAAEANSDMWATPDESSADLIAMYERTWVHGDATIESLSLDALGRVPWWSPEHAEASLGRILIHMATETHRHAGHADIVRELIDGSAGLRRTDDNLWQPRDMTWAEHHARVQEAANHFVEG
jgi:hypothetical protein